MDHHLRDGRRVASADFRGGADRVVRMRRTGPIVAGYRETATERLIRPSGMPLEANAVLGLRPLPLPATNRKNGQARKTATVSDASPLLPPRRPGIYSAETTGLRQPGFLRVSASKEAFIP